MSDENESSAITPEMLASAVAAERERCRRWVTAIGMRETDAMMATGFPPTARTMEHKRAAYACTEIDAGIADGGEPPR